MCAFHATLSPGVTQGRTNGILQGIVVHFPVTFHKGPDRTREGYRQNKYPFAYGTHILQVVSREPAKMAALLWDKTTISNDDFHSELSIEWPEIP